MIIIAAASCDELALLSCAHDLIFAFSRIARLCLWEEEEKDKFRLFGIRSGGLGRYQKQNLV